MLVKIKKNMYIGADDRTIGAKLSQESGLNKPRSVLGYTSQ